MADDDVTLFGRLKSKLIDSKQKWAEEGRLLTGKTAAHGGAGTGAGLGAALGSPARGTPMARPPKSAGRRVSMAALRAFG